MITFTVDLKYGSPAYEQILSAVRKALFTGQLRDGDPFPSVRTLSQELRISPTTAHKVVSMLKNEGILATHPGVGMVVTAATLPSTVERRAMIAPSAKRLVSEARDLSLSLDDTIEELKNQWEHQTIPEAGIRGG